MQKQFIFWKNPPSKSDRRLWVSMDNPQCPLANFIGNEKAVERLCRAAFVAMGNHNHSAAGVNYAVLGPASTGKTTLCKLFAKTLKIPFVELDPLSLDSVEDVFKEIRNTLEENNLDLFDFGNKFQLPPCIVFVDEVHNLKKRVVQGLLKATEPNDSQMSTESGLAIDTKAVCWMIATTDRGDLFDAFDTRFSKINLRLYSKDEVARMIKLVQKDWSIEVCRLAAKFGGIVPREALAFAVDMKMEQDMYPDDWENVSLKVAESHGIDEFGMTNQRLAILKALGRQPISASQLPHIVGVKIDELKKFIIPPLQAITPDQTVPLVAICSRGYTITPAGIQELDKRNIPHNGVDAMPESILVRFGSDFDTLSN